ncbi:MAG TPA: Ig-like domain-containing protein [Candidatus Thermoplasmatota archaeon]|nr:Ig-like domain-containing protein [Candidatus Thermoplasmatota archaeon]
MLNENIIKTMVFITTLTFMCTAFIPTVHSQLGMASSVQSPQTVTTENTMQVMVNNLLQKYQATLIKISPPTPLPLDRNPPNIHLPTSQVTMKVFSSTTSYFRTLLSNVPSGYEVSNTNYTGWCSDSAHTINYNTAYQVMLYSSYNSSLPSHLYHQNWSKVNYILNHKVGSDWHQVEYAILYILNFGNQGLTTNGWTMVNDAIMNGGSYVPGGGDIIAVIADAGLTVQRTIFELTVPTYSLSISVNGMGSVAKDPNQTFYTYSQVVQLTATPDPGWSFSQWSGDLSGSTNPNIITMTSNKTVTATFTLNGPYTLTLTTSGTGSGTIQASPAGPYYWGASVTIWANASTGSTFTGFSGDLSGTTTPQTLVMNGNKAVNAQFTLQGGFTLTLTTSGAGSGTIQASPAGPYYWGASVTIWANASTGSTFAGFSGDLSGTTTPQTLVMNGNKAVNANFTITSGYTLTIIIDGQGTVVKDPEQPTYPYGTNVILTAVADQDWIFSSWSGDLSGNENPKTITMTSNKTVTAHFIYGTEDTIPPLVELVTPINAFYIFNKFILPFKIPIIVQMITIEANASDNESGIDRVEFYIDGLLKGDDSSEPYSYDWKELQSGKHTIKVIAYDNAGNHATSPEILVFKWRLHPILIIPILILGIIWARENP